MLKVLFKKVYRKFVIVRDYLLFRNYRAEGVIPVFLHIPKNAGSSLSDIIRFNYNWHSVYQPDMVGRHDGHGNPKTVHGTGADLDTMRAYIEANRHRISSVIGHVPFGVHEFLDRPCRYFSLLREPVKRCVSLYYYVQLHQSASGGLAEILKAYDWNITGAIGDKKAIQLMNDQTRMIIGSDKVDLDESDLELAKEIIAKHFCYIGTVDRYDDAVSYLCDHFNWKYRDYSSLNKGPSSRAREAMVKLDDASIRFLKEANSIDIKLYDWVRVNIPERRRDGAEI